MMKRTRRVSGFTLVEVVLALGISVVALSAIVAMMSSSLASSKASTGDTVLAVMSAGVVDDLRRQPFANLPGTGDIAAGTQPATATLPLIYFDGMGMRLRDSNGTDITSADPVNYPKAIYQCTVTMLGDTNTLSTSSANASMQSINLLSATLTFQWPVTAGGPNKRIVNATIAHY